jgi:hypothetical protein
MIDSVDFKINVESTYWKFNFPDVTISVDDVVLYDGDAMDPIEATGTVDLEPGMHKLTIRMSGKQPTDTETDEDGNRVNDVLLHIKNIEFDNIDLGYCKWKSSRYYPEGDDTPEYLEGVVDLGWNGDYVIEFESPMYIWLLENLE